MNINFVLKLKFQNYTNKFQNYTQRNPQVYPQENNPQWIKS